MEQSFYMQIYISKSLYIFVLDNLVEVFFNIVHRLLCDWTVLNIKT